MGLWLVVMGGRTAEMGWFRSKTELFHNDVIVMEREGIVQWRTPDVGVVKPAAREFHSLTSLAGGKLLLFGGRLGWLWEARRLIKEEQAAGNSTTWLGWRCCCLELRSCPGWHSPQSQGMSQPDQLGQRQAADVKRWAQI